MKPNNRKKKKIISPTYGELLYEVPSLVVCADLNRSFVFVNKKAWKTLGFKNQDDAEGKLLEEMPCKAAAFAPLFQQQNQMVAETNTEQKFIDIHPFANDEVLTFLTTKVPFNYSDDQSAVICQCTEVSRSLLLNVSLAIVDSDKKFRNKDNLFQRSYQCSSKFQNTNLSQRELECLFYLIRGKTSTLISGILGLSRRTIESYIVNMKYKLQCEKKSDLIEKALSNNFIDFIPASLLENANRQTSILLALADG